MIVVDTSAFVTLASADVLHLVLDEFEVHTTEIMLRELEETAEYEDVHGTAARTVLDQIDSAIVHEGTEPRIQTSRVDEGEGSCAVLARAVEAEFLVTDDLRALPELQTISGTSVAISPIVLKALVERGVLTRAEALESLDQVATDRSWLGRPIYRRARELFED